MSAVIQRLSTELEVVKKETQPVLLRAAGLVVMDPVSYAVADSLLSKLVEARKGIKLRLSRFMDPLKATLDKAKEAYKEAQAFHEEVDAPLAEAEGVVRGRMKGYKLEEARQAQLAEVERIRAADALRRQAEEKALQESKARTQAMRDRLAKQREELEAQADVAQAAPIAMPVKAAGSTTRTVKVPCITDTKAVLTGILAGKIPVDILDFDVSAIKAHYKLNPAAASAWPGIKFVDDIQIVHQGR